VGRPLEAAARGAAPPPATAAPRRALAGSLAGGYDASQAALAHAGAVEPLVALALASRSTAVVSGALAALANLSMRNAALGDALEAAGALRACAALLQRRALPVQPARAERGQMPEQGAGGGAPRAPRKDSGAEPQQGGAEAAASAAAAEAALATIHERAAVLLTNLVAGSPARQRAACDAGALPALVWLLVAGGGRPEVLEAAAGALGNCCQGNEGVARKVGVGWGGWVGCAAAASRLALADGRRHGPPGVPTWLPLPALAPLGSPQALEARAAPALSRLLMSRDDGVLCRALGTASLLAAAGGGGEGGGAAALVAAGAVPRLVALACSSRASPQARVSACHALAGVVAKGGPAARAAAIEADAPEAAAALLAPGAGRGSGGGDGVWQLRAAAAGCVAALCSGSGNDGTAEAAGACRTAFVRAGGLAMLLALLGAQPGGQQGSPGPLFRATA
jgi:hypothetical protein